MEGWRMIDLRDCQTIQVMPEVFRKDAQVQAASYALQQTAKMLMEKIDRAGVYAMIDRMPEPIVDLLAEELRAQYYDPSLPVEDKRGAVKNALPWHKKAGTAAAVRELTNFVWKSGSAKVQEWFEYSSDPYLFRILLGTDMCIEEEKINIFLHSLWKVKNTRSHLESITFMRRLDNFLYMGAASRSCGRIVVMDTWRGQYHTQKDMYIGLEPSRVKRIRIREG